jgi:hypothetical protein
MKHTNSKMLAMCCAMAMTAGALAQHDKTTEMPKKGEVPATKMGQPGDKKSDSPGMPPEMMKAWMDAGKVGPMHDWLAKFEGTWETTCKMMMPGEPTSESKGTMTSQMMLGKRFCHSTYKGEMDMGGQKVPFEGVACMGYNNTTQKFESTWVDSMSTGTMMMTGTLSADKKTLTMTGECADPMTHQMKKSREVTTWTGDDRYTMAFYEPGMDGKETQVMEISYVKTKGGMKDAMDKSKDEALKRAREMEETMTKPTPPTPAAGARPASPP